ncbi:hypothetical protein HMPREF1250_0352 [Megasphaera vaginalis (ex Srinivasan et al. 2021)]|uniref:Uncharacterized protein n=1 Tax=Megasphaera vaginalis (ex Srinivasan et al. 2021) TaxID=1111454 RepID=U7UMK7_9FIRM|nr:hypothetical protein HMPREF1250_0352 [Megasphaera vaginalis (ex Srinivasan et al. 2021)]
MSIGIRGVFYINISILRNAWTGRHSRARLIEERIRYAGNRVIMNMMGMQFFLEIN